MVLTLLSPKLITDRISVNLIDLLSNLPSYYEEYTDTVLVLSSHLGISLLPTSLDTDTMIDQLENDLFDTTLIGILL